MLVLVGHVVLLSNLDVPIAIALRDHSLPKGLRKSFSLAEIGGHGNGAAMLLVASFALSGLRWRRHRAIALRLVLATFAGGIISAGIKGLVTRVRPRSALLELAVQNIDTFGRQLLSPDASQTSGSVLMSFPSGHSAVAAGLAASLCRLAPRGRWVFIILAVMACFQRLMIGAHYLSDVCIGAALGLLGAALLLPVEPQRRLDGDDQFP